MPTFTAGGTTPAAASAAPYASIHAASTRRLFPRECGFFTTAATQSSVGLGIPANNATPPVATTSILGQAHDAADATATGNIDTAWSTPPTAPSVYMRKVTLGAAIGAGVIWKLALDERIAIAKSSWLTWFNYGGGAGSALDLYCEWDE